MFVFSINKQTSHLGEILFMRNKLRINKAGVLRKIILLAKKNKLKRVVFLIIILLATFPFILKHNFSEFLNYPLQQNDLTWKRYNVNCLKEDLNNVRQIQFFGIKEDAVISIEKYHYFQYQYLFAPIILITSDYPIQDWFILYYSENNLDFLKQKFPNHNIVKCSGNLYLLKK